MIFYLLFWAVLQLNCCGMDSFFVEELLDQLGHLHVVLDRLNTLLRFLQLQMAGGNNTADIEDIR